MSLADTHVSTGDAARARGDLQAAANAYIAALQADPAHLKAKSGLARVYIATRQWSDAERFVREVLATDPSHVEARYSLASCRLERGDAEGAEALLTALIDEGKTASAIRFVRGRARLELMETDGALDDLRAAYAKSPDALKLRALAGALWMLGDRAGFDALIAAAPPELAALCADILREAGEPAAALVKLDAAPRTADTLTARANVLKEQGDAAGARAAAAAAVNADPNALAARDALISASLMLGDAAAALSLVQPLRAAYPNDQHWIAHEATALRLLGDPAYEKLVRIEEHVRVYELPVPDGYESVEAFNAAMLAALDVRRPYRVHPLNQSLRGGVQTSRDLFAFDDPVFAAYAQALDVPIRAYLADIGAAPDHPLTVRNTARYRFAGCWSVALGPGGRHVNHVHPAGWISSAYYVSVPEETASGDGKAGWIKFGEPPHACDPPLAPERWIQPRAGLVVLFPSFLWHGVEPIGAGASRVTAPFDLVPA